MPVSWMSGVAKLCRRYRLEASMTRDPLTDAIVRVQFNCPKDPAKEEKDALARVIPQGIELTYLVHPKWSIIGQIQQDILGRTALIVDHDDEGAPTGIIYDPDTRQLELKVHTMELNISSPDFGEGQVKGALLPAEHEIWDVMARLAKRDGALDSIKVSCEAEGFEVMRDLTALPEPEVEQEDEDDVLASDGAGKDVPVPPAAPQPPAHVDHALDALAKKGKDLAKQAKAKTAMQNLKIEQPVRERKIDEDAVTDVKIALGASQDVNDFLKSLESGEKKEGQK